MHLFTSATDGNHGGGFSLIHSDSHYANAIVVPDAELLFTGTFHRSGLDLVLTGHDGRHHVIPSYFASEHPPALMAPSGAHLTPEVVDMLAGSPAPHEYAQAGAQTVTPPDSIGKVQKVTGTVTVVRNGVSVAVNLGDVVYKSDVIITAADSKCGITFPDGTALELLPNTRMALNEYNYDAHSTSNQALFTLIDGTFGFVAGKVAHSGDMKIGTPVATMGIRGTTGVVQHVAKAPSGTINATIADETYSFSVYDDPGTTTSGWWDMFVQNSDGSESLITTVSQTGYVTFVTPQGTGLPPLVTTVPLNPSQLGNDQQILQDLFETYALGGPRSMGIPGSGDNPLLQLPPDLLPGLNGSAGPYTFNYNPPAPPGLLPPQDPQAPSNPTASNIFIWSSPNSQGFPLGPFWNQGTFPTSPNDIVIILNGTSLYPSTFNLIFFSLRIDGPGQNGGLAPGEFLMLGGGLQVTNGLDVFGTLFLQGDPPFFASYGPSTIYTGGKVIVTGAGSVAEFSPNLANPVTAAVVVDNFGKMVAKSGGDIEFIDATVKNEAANAANAGNTTGTSPAGRIAAVGDGAIVDFTNVTFDNAGIVVAKNTGESGGVFFVNTDVTNEAGARITAKDGGTITFATSNIVGDPLGIQGKVDNFGLIDAKIGGQITFEVAVKNETDARITSLDCGSLISFTGDELDNFSLVRAAFGGTIKFDGETIVNEGANSKIEAKDGGRIKILGGSVSNLSGAVITASEHGSIYLASTASNLLGVTNFDGAKITAADCGTITFKDVGLFNNAGALIEAKNHGIVTVIETKGSTAGVMNAGTIKAADHGILAFVDVGVGTSGGVMNAGGLIEAIGCGAQVDLSSSTIVGGTLQTRDGGLIEAVRGRSTFLNVLINGGIVAVDRHASLALKGDTVIDKTVTFEGSGVFELKGSDKITGSDAHALLKNDSTITGSGTIGDNGLTLINESCGTILASGGFGHPLTIDTGSKKVTNYGFLEAIRCGELDIESKLDNYGRVIATYGGDVVANADVFNKHGALIEAEHSGTVILDGINIRNDVCATIDAKGEYATVFIDGSTVRNAGIVEAKWGGTVSIAETTIDNSCGLIAAYDFGATVELMNSTVTGGTLATGDPCSPCSGVIDILAPDTDGANIVVFDGSNEKVTVDGFVRVEQGATLELIGTIDNNGKIDLDPASGAGATLEIEGIVKLEGNGDVVLDGHNDEITGIPAGDSAKLENFSEISGYGKIGANGDELLELVNKANGIVDADVSDKKLFIETGNTVANVGLLEASRGGILDIEDDVNNEGGTIEAHRFSSVVVDGVTIHNSDDGANDGLVAADGCGATVVLYDGTDIIGGTLSTSDGGLIEIANASGHTHADVMFDGSETISGSILPLTIDGEVRVDESTALTLKGTIDLVGGVIELDQQAHHDSNLVIDNTVTLNGDGYVVLEGNGTAIVGGAGAGGTLINNSAIYGLSGGSIGTGDNSLTFINHSIVDSEGAHAGQIVINTGDQIVINNGLLEATTDSELDLYGTYANQGGLISAGEPFVPSVVKLFGATICGGTLLTDFGHVAADGSAIEIVAAHVTSVFDGSQQSVIVDAYVNVDSGAQLELIGTISDFGIINIDEAINGADLVIDGTVNLVGGGEVVLAGADDCIIGAGPEDNTLINSDTITGYGQIGDAGSASTDLTLTNNGTIDADVAGQTLVIHTGHTVSNQGILEASSGGILQIGDAVHNSGSGGALIAGGTLDFMAKSNVDVTFESGAYGVLMLSDAAEFTGKIFGFSGTAAGTGSSDAVDLVGFDEADTTFTSHVHNGITTVTLTDSSGDDLSAILNFSGTHFSFALGTSSDGTYLFDPPSAYSSAKTSAEGTLSFGDNNAASDLSASVTPEGSGYAGSLTLDSVGESSGTASVDYGFALGNDQINVAAGQTVTQSYQVSLADAQNPAANTTQTVAVTIGGAGNDNFVFAPGVGHDTVLNFNAQQDTVELDHFANAQTVQELQSLITADTHGNAVLDLGNHDSITFLNTTQAQLQQAVQNGHVLLH